MSELEATAGAEWVRMYSGDLTAAELKSAMEWARQTDRGACTALDHLAWTEITRRTLEAYRALLGSRPM